MSLARVVRPIFRTCSGVFAVSLILGGLYAVANADESSNDVSKSSFVKRPYVAIGAGPTHLKPRSPSPIALTIQDDNCLLYTSPSPRDRTRSRMPSSA